MRDANAWPDPARLVIPVLALVLLLPSIAFADQDGERLIQAVRGGDAALVADLLSGGVSPEARHGKDSAMTWAAVQGDLESLNLLYSHGARLDADAALAAAVEGHLEVIELLLRWGMDIEVSDPYGMSLLMTAALHGREDLVAFLLERGASVSVREVVYGYTPLMLASAHGHPRIVQMLIASGADVNAETDTKESALGWASRRLERGPDFREVAQILEEYGAQP